jgi:secreted trypsin-like serine protease
MALGYTMGAGHRNSHLTSPSRAPWIGVCAAACWLLAATPALAIMAGAPPDAPAARVDANVPGSLFAGVAAINVNGGTYSGVVIAPQYVLTAGHVAAAGSAASMQVILNAGGTPWTSAVLNATIYPTFSFPYDDLAVLQLAAPVPAGIPVYPMYGGPLQTGLILVLAGYGESGNGNVGPSVGSATGVKRTGENTLDELTTTLDNSGLTSRFFVYDFDGPSGAGPLGGPTLGNAIETMVAVGDSGGPSFVQVGAGLQVLGINTFAASTVPNQSPTYTFGNLGGGIVAADPRFAAWLQTTTQGTMPAAASGENDSDGPLPLWSYVLLGGALWVVTLARCGHGSRPSAL